MGGVRGELPQDWHLRVAYHWKQSTNQNSRDCRAPRREKRYFGSERLAHSACRRKWRTNWPIENREPSACKSWIYRRPRASLGLRMKTMSSLEAIYFRSWFPSNSKAARRRRFHTPRYPYPRLRRRGKASSTMGQMAFRYVGDSRPLRHWAMGRLLRRFIERCWGFGLRCLLSYFQPRLDLWYVQKIHLVPIHKLPYAVSFFAIKSISPCQDSIVWDEDFMPSFVYLRNGKTLGCLYADIKDFFDEEIQNEKSKLKDNQIMEISDY